MKTAISTSVTGELSTPRLAAYAIALTLTQLASHAVSAVPLTAEYLLLSIAGGILAAPLLAILFSNLPLRPRARFLVIWLGLFIVQMFADLIEGAFFTTRISTPSIFLGGVLVALVITLLESLAGLILFPSAFSTQSSGLALKTYFRERRWLSRIAAGSVAYFPIYFLFGALVSPIVIPYYTDPSLGLGLTIPSFIVLIPIELLRGLLFTVALVPIIASVRLSKKNTFIFTASFLYLIGAYIPFVAGTTLPWTLKLFHSLEILADSIVYGGILTYLFKQPDDRVATPGENDTR